MSRSRAPRIRIGTSGWRHRHWRGLYYPDALPMREWLAHYAAEFDCVEVESSFYRLPEPDAIARWCTAVPAGFTFTVKAPRAITHYKKLKNCENEIQRLAARLDLFGDRLGPIVFELPSRWRVNVRRLEAFLGSLPEGRRYAFDLRDPTWHGAEVRALLRAHGAAACADDRSGAALPREPTGGFAYVRLRGPRDAHTGSYRGERLRRWAGDALGWARSRREVFVIFANDDRAWAVKNAARLRSIIADGPAHPGVEVA